MYVGHIIRCGRVTNARTANVPHTATISVINVGTLNNLKFFDPLPHFSSKHATVSNIIEGRRGVPDLISNCRISFVDMRNVWGKK